MLASATYLFWKTRNFSKVLTISEEQGEDGSILVKLAAAQEDMGRIIGKQGRTAKAMRTLLNAKATRVNKRATLQIME